MKRLLCTAAAIAMIVPAAASAQPMANKMAAQPVQRPGNKPGRPGHNRPQPGQPTIQPIGPGHPGHRPDRPGNRPDRPDNRPNRPGHGHRPPVTIQPIKPTKPYRPGHRPHIRPIHRPGFRYPHGYGYRRWHIGLFLPHVFLHHYYYFNDWALLGLGPPPPGYVWVRYGPDLLLVDRFTGRIADVIYGAFY